MARNYADEYDPIYGGFQEYGTGKFRPNAAAAREGIIRRMYVRVFLELASNRFKWTGLPAEIDVRHMELTLLRRALSVFHYDEDYGKFFASVGTASGQRNLNDEPVAYTIVGKGTYNTKMLRKDQCVPIWANYLQMPDIDIIEIYSQKLASLDRTIEINAAQARRARILVAGKNQRLTQAQVSRQLDEGQPVIGVDSSYDLESIKAFDLGVDPEKIEKLHILRVREWNTAMGLLGINNANQDKKERLVADEVAANDQQVTAMRDVALNARRRACNEIRRMYGINAWVEFGSDPDPVAVPAPMSADDMLSSTEAGDREEND